jgi:putative ABC transport system permease protein
LVAFAVSRRTREIGIRMAIGATTRDVLGMFMRQGLRPAWFGLPIGLALSLVMVQTMPGFVTGARFDMRLFVLVVPAIVATVLFATFVPARRASRVNPTEALRYE